MFVFTIVGVILIVASVVLLVVSVRTTPESRARFLANWWALACAWFGIVFVLSRELVR